jgi:hypothetical protein
MKRAVTLFFLCLLMAGCAGMYRGCSSYSAQALGANWLVVQFDNAGKPFNCWQLRNTSIANEQASDGIYWVDGSHLIHISGWYNRVQINGNSPQDFEQAAKLLGIELNRCTNGAYK